MPASTAGRKGRHVGRPLRPTPVGLQGPRLKPAGPRTQRVRQCPCRRAGADREPVSRAAVRLSSEPCTPPTSRWPDVSLEHVDVLIVGAGLSGIGAGHHLQANCPQKTYAILEARDCIGGTWDLFRYPGIRSDSDMFTLGYSFRPWKEAKAIADGPSILKYIRDTAKDYGIDKNIRFDHRVTRASWSSADAAWTVEMERGPSHEVVRFTCNFLFMCSGYYSYAAGYTPD